MRADKSTPAGKHVVRRLNPQDALLRPVPGATSVLKEGGGLRLGGVGESKGFDTLAVLGVVCPQNVYIAFAT